MDPDYASDQHTLSEQSNTSQPQEHTEEGTTNDKHASKLHLPDDNTETSVTSDNGAQEQYAYFSNQLPLVAASTPTKPVRSTQALHLVMQEISRGFIFDHLAQRPSHEILVLFKDVRKLSTELQQYATNSILCDVKEKILSELPESERSILADLQPHQTVFKMRFEDREAVYQSFEDAMAELRYEYNGNKVSVAARGGFPAAMPEVFRLFDQWMARRSSQKHDTLGARMKRPAGRFDSRGRVGRGFRGAPYHPSAPPARGRDGSTARGGMRDLKDRRVKEDQPGRKKRDNTAIPFYDRSRPSDRQDDRLGQRINPPIPTTDSRFVYNMPSHPPAYHTLQPPPSAVPIPQPASDPVYSYHEAGLPAPAYDPAVHSHSSQHDAPVTNAYHYNYGTQATAATPPWPHPPNTPLQLQSFSSRDPGRYTTLPLPIDFAGQSSDASRVFMREPCQQLGVIKGVIVRDAQGNIGLTSYTFSPFS